MYEFYDEHKMTFDDYGNGTSNIVGESLPWMSRVLQVVRSGVNEAKKSKVDTYLEEDTFDFQGSRFDALERWKDKATNFRILSKVAADVLPIPITTIASEATFSAESRVINPYRASLLPEAVKMLICTRD